MKLTDKKIAQAKPREKEYPLADGHGLVLIVKPNGGKYWVHRFYFEKKKNSNEFGRIPPHLP